MIRNDSSYPMRDVRIDTLGQVDLEIPLVAPKSVTFWSFDLKSKGPVRFSSTLNGAPWNDDDLSEYASPGDGGRARTTIPGDANTGSSGP